MQIEVRGVDGELKRIAEAALTTKPNFAYTLSEIQEDIGRVFDTGYFTKTVPISEDTRDGVKLTIEVGFLGVVVNLHAHANVLR